MIISRTQVYRQNNRIKDTSEYPNNLLDNLEAYMLHPRIALTHMEAILADHIDRTYVTLNTRARPGGVPIYFHPSVHTRGRDLGRIL